MSKKNEIQIIIPKGASTNIENGLVELTRQIRLKTGESGGFGLGGQDGYGIEYENKTFSMKPFYWGECDCGWLDFYDNKKFKEKHSKQCYQSLVDVAMCKAGWKKDEFGYLEKPKNLSYDEATKIENKIRKKYCKQFNLSFPGGCAIHCTCGRDERFDKWHIEQIKKFKGNATELDEYDYPESHKKTCSLIVPNFIYKPTKCNIEWYKYIGRDQKQKGKLPKNWLENCIKSLWKKGDCWYEFDIEPRDMSEIIMNRQEPPKIHFCFDAINSNTIISAELSLMAEDNIDFWNFDEILDNISNTKIGYTKEYKKIIELNKKYPALRKKIKLDAIQNCNDKIIWLKKRIKSLSS